MNELYGFQKEGVGFLKPKRRAYLADGMGMGKSVQAAVAAQKIGVQDALVVCPASAVENWKREWAAWGPLTTFNVISYAKLIQSELDPAHLGSLTDLVILDEAHYCKTHTAQRTIAALRAAQQSPRAWLLSGTPMPNHPGELYACFAALWPGVLRQLGIRNHEEWFDHFCHWFQTDHGKKPYKVKNGADLRPYLDRIMLRRQIGDTDVDLPPLRVTHHRLPRDGYPAAIEDEHMATERRLLGEFKAPLVATLIKEELAVGAYQKIVVGCHHIQAMEIMRHELRKDFRTAGFVSSDNSTYRQKMIDRFTDDPKIRVFFVPQAAGREAINLQVSTEIALVEPDWVPDNNSQFIKRIHRIGSVLPCRARVFTVAGTQDDKILSAAITKIQMQVDTGLRAA